MPDGRRPTIAGRGHPARASSTRMTTSSIVDKPAGLVTHPAPGHPSGTLVNALLGRRGDRPASRHASRASERPGIVHRLDRDTSGLIVVARNDAAQVALQAQLKARRVRKTLPGAGDGATVAAAGPHREAHRPRPAAPSARWPCCPTAGRRSPATGCASDSAGWTLLEVRPRDRADAPDPRPPRVHRSSGRGRPGVRHRRCSARARWPGAPLPSLVADRVRGRDRGTTYPR